MIGKEKDIFNIELSNKKLEEKCKVADYILFESNIPNTDFIGEISLVKGLDSTPYALISNYFLTYGILHELLQIYNNINKDTFNYFCQNIFNRQETNISELKKIISKREKIKEENIIGFDFSDSNFFLNQKNIKYEKGSDMSNFSTCYNNIRTPMKILNVFLLKNLKENSVIIIKIPNIISTVVIDYLKILTFIFHEIKIFKLVQDSFFKDSFHVILSRPNINRYNQVKEDIKKNIKANNIKNIDEEYIKSIITYDIEDQNQEFISKIKEFATVLETLIATYMLNIIKALKISTSNNYRNPNDWHHLDFYFSKCL